MRRNPGLNITLFLKVPKSLFSQLYSVIIPVIIILILLPPASLFPEENHRRILYISSYHPGFPTFNQQVAGIKSVFNSGTDIVDVEFMDTKRFPQKENIEQFHRMLSWKLSKVSRYDSIIVADDAALRYAMSQESGIFKGIPLFFCGVNDIKYAAELNNGKRTRGIIEAVSAEETLELIPVLFPGRKNIVIITDPTPAGQSDLKTVLISGKRLSLKYSILSLKIGRAHV